MQNIPPNKGSLMAICFTSLRVIGLGQNRKSPMAMAMYIERAKGKDYLTDSFHNYKDKKADFITSKVILPSNATSDMNDFMHVWKKAIMAEENKDIRSLTQYKKNAQFAYDITLALPKEISKVHHVKLVEAFARKLYVSKGLLVHYAIHHPMDNKDNPHAHLLVSTREVNGNGFGKKIREVNPKFNNNYLIKEHDLGTLTPRWIDEQNNYFLENNIDLRVDPEKIVPEQKMQKGVKENSIKNKNKFLKKKSEEYAKDPKKLFKFMEKRYSYFSQNDIKKVLKINGIYSLKKQNDIVKSFLNLSGILTLTDKQGNEFYTTEKRRFLDFTFSSLMKNMAKDKGKNVSVKSFMFLNEMLEREQKPDEEKIKIIKSILRDSSQIVGIKGKAGTGKSYTIELLKKSYDLEGANVIGLSPTHAVCNDLRKASIQDVYTVHSLSYQIEKGLFDFKDNDVVIIDEAGMISTEVILPIMENAYKNNAKVVMVGDDRQLSSIDAGGAFSEMRRWGKVYDLENVYRQKSVEHRKATSLFGAGKTVDALNMYKEKEQWTTDVEYDALNAWKNKNYDMILAFKNETVNRMNSLIQDYRIEENEIDNVVGYEVINEKGITKNIKVGVGDKIALTDKYDNRTKGDIGVVLGLSEKEIIVDFNGEVIFADRADFKSFDLGYAITVHKAQGKTYDKVMTVVDSRFMWCSELAYVSYTRHKEDLDIIIDEKQFSNVEKPEKFNVVYDGVEYYVDEEKEAPPKEFYDPRDVFLSASSETKTTSMHLKCDEYAEQEKSIRQAWDNIDDSLIELNLLDQIDRLEDSTNKISSPSEQYAFKEKIKIIKRRLFNSNTSFKEKVGYIAYLLKDFKLYTSLQKLVVKNKNEHNNSVGIKI